MTDVRGRGLPDVVTGSLCERNLYHTRNIRVFSLLEAGGRSPECGTGFCDASTAASDGKPEGSNIII